MSNILKFFKKANLPAIIIEVLLVMHCIMLKTLFAPCPTGMRCVDLTHNVLVLTFVCVILNASVIAGPFRNIQRFVSGFIIAEGLILVGMTFYIGGCVNMEMRCNVYTIPYIQTMYTITSALQMIFVIFTEKNKRITK